MGLFSFLKHTPPTFFMPRQFWMYTTSNEWWKKQQRKIQSSMYKLNDWMLMYFYISKSGTKEATSSFLKMEWEKCHSNAQMMS